MILMMMIDNNNNNDNYDINDFDDNDDDDGQPVNEKRGEPRKGTGALPRICSKVPEICAAILITHRQDCHLLEEKEGRWRRARFCDIMSRMVVVVMLLMMIRIIIIMRRRWRRGGGTILQDS